MKRVRTPEYNYDFNPETGMFRRWGSYKKDDPLYSPIGPEIADIEISTICHGINGIPCPHCYKSNSGIGSNMSLETFKIVFSKLPKNVTQIAFGIGDIDSNPEMMNIFWYCRNNGVIPNVTVNGWNITDDWAAKLAEVCGAVAVSRYDDKNVCYNAVERLTFAGLKQVNIHQLVSKETYTNCLETIKDIKTDQRLRTLNAIVFLSLKKKGRGEGYNTLEQDKFNSLMENCFNSQIRFGFDSCSAHKVITFIEEHPEWNQGNIIQMIEPCESTLFSIYINVNGRAFPCSFCEGLFTGCNIPSLQDRESFLSEIWYDSCHYFRKELLKRERKCPIYEV
jgi:hypothetical protein